MKGAADNDAAEERDSSLTVIAKVRWTAGIVPADSSTSAVRHALLGGQGPAFLWGERSFTCRLPLPGKKSSDSRSPLLKSGRAVAMSASAVDE